jgi:hypothetical protein
VVVYLDNDRRLLTGTNQKLAPGPIPRVKIRRHAQIIGPVQALHTFHLDLESTHQ